MDPKLQHLLFKMEREAYFLYTKAKEVKEKYRK